MMKTPHRVFTLFGRILAVIVIVITASVAVTPARAQSPPHGQHWVGTWSTAQVALLPPESPDSAQAAGPQGQPVRVNDQTLRQVVRVSIGGSRIRVALSNTFGTEPLYVGAAHVALSEGDGQIAALSSASSALTFDGESSATIEVGSILVSDPVDIEIAALSDLAVDLYLPGDTWGTTSPGTVHGSAWATSYLSRPGNHVGAPQLSAETTAQSWLYLARVDVLAAAGTNAIVTFGDSITEGYGSTPDTNHRWPDLLARRLRERFGEGAPAVMNMGISGNRVLSHNGLPFFTGSDRPDPYGGFGPSALSRFDRDVLLQPGVTHVVVLESINDIGMTRDPAIPTVDDLIVGHRALIQRAHARGLTVYAGTLTPFEGAAYWSEAGEEKRQAVNEWIRTSGAYDGGIDFDAAVRDPASPNRFVESYQAGDWLHPNDVGYQRMADAIDVTMFTRRLASVASAGGAPRTPWGAPDVRTSLIVDPRDGRIPDLTADATRRRSARRGTWQRPIRERVRINSPAHGPEDLGLSERGWVTRVAIGRTTRSWSTRPFTAAIPMRRTQSPLCEYACPEGNYGMRNLLAGARALERETAEER